MVTKSCLFMALICAGADGVESADTSDAGGMLLVFWNAADVVDPLGKIQFGAEMLRIEGRASGFPEMQFACEVVDEGGLRWVYGWRVRSEGDTRSLEVIRCRTLDGKTFTNSQSVFKYANKDWQGFANIVHRPTDGALFLFSWAPASLHVFRSDNGTDWKLLTTKAYGDHDAMCVTWHEKSRGFLNYQHTLEPYEKRYPDNIGKFRRAMSFRRSTDGVQWSSFSPSFLNGRAFWLPDNEDPADLEFYRCVVFPIQNRYAMLLVDYLPHPPEANPRRATTKHSSRYITEWAISPDGMNWQRPFRGTDAVEKAIWTAVQGPLFREGTLRFYHPNGQIASIPDDRIFYVTCRSNGEFMTQPFTMPTGGLLLNAHARYRPGEKPGQAVIMAELRDEDGSVLPGYELTKCLIENRDGRAIPLVWDGQSGTEHAGRKVRLHFFLRDAKIYGVAPSKPADR
jgi:hypothetical protein